MDSIEHNIESAQVNVEEGATLLGKVIIIFYAKQRATLSQLLSLASQKR